ncbi:MAG: alkaline phosphatase PafA [Balneolaceae bacterium]
MLIKDGFKWVLSLLLLFSAAFGSGCNKSISNLKTEEHPPTLVIGITVDQMRPDYLSRFWDKLGDDGFKRLLNEGFSFTNTHFNYMPTATGPGHASIYTGTTPSVHGIMGNSWFKRDLNRSINVIEVPGYKGVGSAPGYDGRKSPENMLTTTIGDELRLHTNNRSKVIGISRKDRGAILPAGHTGEAYWYEPKTGNFVSSDYYMDELQAWVLDFNSRKLADEYLSGRWETLLPIEEYVESIEDNNPYERIFRGQKAPVFPYDLSALKDEYGTAILSTTPFSNDLLLELAIATMEGAKLGRNSTTDILAIGFSAVDAVGHFFGPASKELQDTFLRLDRNIAQLLKYVDQEHGKENVLIFLTSDHGVAHVPDYVTSQKIPGGHFDISENMNALSEHLSNIFGADVYLNYSNFEIFLNHEILNAKGLNHYEVQNEAARFLLTLDGVTGVLTAESLTYNNFTSGIKMRVQNGFNPKRSGDVLFWLEPQITHGTAPRGSSHASPWSYDTHAPLYWYGWNITAGKSSAPVGITDIAPTLSTFLKIPFPNGNTGNPLNDYMKQEGN